jgi:polyribonucleotide nucleotidyltransferase
VIARSGESMVLVTSVCAESDREFDFLPLSVEYMDRSGAAGAIPGGYFKREGRSSERETLISRLIDRPIRPLFPKHFRQETQVIAQVMSYDPNHETDWLALCAASASLHVSDAPITEPAAGVRVCQVDGALVLNPDRASRERATIDLVIAGTKDAIIMVEGEAKEASEDVVLQCFDLAQEAITRICACIEALRAESGKAKLSVPAKEKAEATISEAMKAAGLAGLQSALGTAGKHERKTSIKAARDAAIAQLAAGKEGAELDAFVKGAKLAWEELVRDTMRLAVLDTRKRLDGRSPSDVRSIWCEISMAPRAHGSAIFTRGETQAFVTCALGTEDDIQRIEEPTGQAERRWMLTYNFLPYCTGEARPLRAPKRREIGHGNLARRAIESVLPDKKDFRYAIRCTSEIFESNGSSSMATVCGSTLAMMDAGVPIKAPVAGIAMGLIQEGDRFAVLSDILGDEDALGDMDFKVTGTANGITAFQMDCKVGGVSKEIMSAALRQARDGRIHILGEMAKAIAAPRGELSRYAPRITSLHIKTDKIRDVIGPGGKVIRGIQEACGVKVSVDDSGRVDVASNDPVKTEKAIAMIREITQEAEIGALYVGIVKRIVDFGAFVEIFPGTDGLVHISELARERVEKVTDVLHEGDEVLVRVIDIDRAGKIRLSRKDALDASSR